MTRAQQNDAESKRDDLRWDLISWSDAHKVSGKNQSNQVQRHLSEMVSSFSEPEAATERVETPVSSGVSLPTNQDIEKKLEAAGYYASIKESLEKAQLDPVRTTSAGERVDMLDPVITLKNLSIASGSFSDQSEAMQDEEAAAMMKYKQENTDSAVRNLISTIVDHSYLEAEVEDDSALKPSPDAEPEGEISNEENSGKNFLVVLALVLGMILAIAAGVILG